MNRKLMLGIASFLAIVGVALIGADNEVEAGRGCGGGLLSRLHARKAADCGCPAPAPVCPAPAPVCAPACEPACPPTCGGGLMSRLKAKHAARKAARKAKKCCPAPDPCCPAPAPEPCCAPAPAPAPCCAAPAPAPAPCCGSAPSPMVMEAAPVAAAPCCGGDVMMSQAPMTDGVVYGVPTDASHSSMGGGLMVNDRGEEIVPGSVQVINDGSGDAAPAPVEAAVEAATDGI